MYSGWGFSCLSSDARQMTVKFKRCTPTMAVFSQKVPPPPNPNRSALLVSTTGHLSNESSFRKGQTAWWDYLPTGSNSPSVWARQDFNVSKSPVTVYKALCYQFQLCSCWWFNPARDDVPPLSLVGWLQQHSPWRCQMCCLLKLWYIDIRRGLLPEAEVVR
jgi:hypothetical protein